MSKQGCNKAVITGFFQSICGRSKAGKDIYLCPECTQLEADKQLLRGAWQGSFANK